MASESEIKVGDKIPEFEFGTFGADGKPTKTSTQEIFDNKKVVLFSVPGAFTPTCSNSHCPAYVLLGYKFKQYGVDTVACTAVNDVFVMKAWSESQNANGKILFLADGSAEFVQKIGLSQNLSQFGLGVRGKRFAMVVENGIVKYLGIDPQGLEKSSAEAVEEFLKSAQPASL